MRDYSDSHQDLVLHATWAITHVAGGSSEQTQYIVNLRALPVLKQLLLNPNNDLKDCAVVCLGNIAGDSTANRDLVVALGVRDIFFGFLQQNEHMGLKRSTVWAIATLFGVNPKLPFSERLPYFPTVVVSLRATNQDTIFVENALWALVHILEDSGDDPHSANNATFSDLVESLSSVLLEPNTPEGAEAALRLFEVLIKDYPAQKQKWLDAGIVQGLSHVIIRFAAMDLKIIQKATNFIVFLMVDSINRLELLGSLVDEVCKIFARERRHDHVLEKCCKIFSEFIEAANHDQLGEVMKAIPLPVVLTYFVRANNRPRVVSARAVMDRLFSKIGINSCWELVSRSAYERYSTNPLFTQAIPRLVVRHDLNEPIDWINLLVAYGLDISATPWYFQGRVRELNVLTLLVSPAVIVERRKILWLSSDIWRLFVKFYVTPTPTSQLPKVGRGSKGAS